MIVKTRKIGNYEFEDFGTYYYVIFPVGVKTPTRFDIVRKTKWITGLENSEDSTFIKYVFTEQEAIDFIKTQL